MLDFQDEDTRQILEPYKTREPREGELILSCYDVPRIVEDFVKLTAAAQASIAAIEEVL